jgi:phage terminase large subunit-like protein
VIYAAPADADPWDEAVWRACNPALGRFRSLEELRAAAVTAQAVPGREASFRRFYLNQWGQASEARWLDVEAWDACREALDGSRSASDGGGRYVGIPLQRAFLGLDLASTQDLTALAIVRPGADGTVALRVEFWVPSDTIALRERRDRVPYAQWVAEGWLSVTPGNTTDYQFIEQRLYTLMRELDIAEVGADPWNGKDLLTRAYANGVPIVEVPQTTAHLSAASKALETLILNGRLRHDGNPVMRWCVANCVVDTDANGNLRPSKKRSTEKIDGVSATVSALARWLVAAGPSVYDQREPVLVEL